MKPRITVITLGVDDLERSLEFYRDGLGLDIAYDTKITQTVSSPTEFTIGHNVGSKEEVDNVMEQTKKAGAIITVDPHDTFWGGYSGYFQDPDGHLWEVVWNPQWE